MADESNSLFPAQLVQGTLAAVLSVGFAAAYPNKAKEAVFFANALSMGAVWLGHRLMKRRDADEKAAEPTRGLRLLRAELQRDLAKMKPDDPRRAQRVRQEAELTEFIFQKTVATPPGTADQDPPRLP